MTKLDIHEAATATHSSATAGERAAGTGTASPRVRSPRPYWNPYLSGVLLGFVLFGSYVLTGHGLGASGGLARLVTCVLKVTDHSAVDTHSFFATLGGGDKNPLSAWIVWEILGVAIGGAISGIAARRFYPETNHGPRLTVRWRWVFALLGGALVGWSTQLSRGCTSGQALSGGAILTAGSWAFMFAIFGGAYLVARPFARLWR